MNAKNSFFMTAGLCIAIASSSTAQGLGNSPFNKATPPRKGITPLGVHEVHEGDAPRRLLFPEITGPHVLIVSASGLAGTNLLEMTRQRLMTVLRLPVKAEFRLFDGSAAELAKAALAKPDVVAVVAIKDELGAPSLVAMPEQKIVLINPLAWCPPGTDAELAEKRVGKMIQRGFCAVLGATVAPVFSAKDLDALRGGIAPSVLSSVFRYGSALGLEHMTPLQIESGVEKESPDNGEKRPAGN